MLNEDTLSPFGGEDGDRWYTPDVLSKSTPLEFWTQLLVFVKSRYAWRITLWGGASGFLQEPSQAHVHPVEVR